jgi:hypothetical protein
MLWMHVKAKDSKFHLQLHLIVIITIIIIIINIIDMANKHRVAIIYYGVRIGAYKNIRGTSSRSGDLTNRYLIKQISTKQTQLLRSGLTSLVGKTCDQMARSMLRQQQQQQQQKLEQYLGSSSSIEFNKKK